MNPLVQNGGGRARADGQEIRSVADIVTARHRARAIAISVGFTGEDVTDITVKVSEIARRILDRSEKGEIVVRAVSRESDRGITIVGYHDGLGESTMAITKWLGKNTPRRPLNPRRSPATAKTRA